MKLIFFSLVLWSNISIPEQMQTPNKPHHTSLHHTEVAVWCTVSFRVIVVMFCKEYNDVTIVVTLVFYVHMVSTTRQRFVQLEIHLMLQTCCFLIMSYPGMGKFLGKWSVLICWFDFCGATSGAKLMHIAHKMLLNWNWDFEMKSPQFQCTRLHMVRNVRLSEQVYQTWPTHWSDSNYKLQPTTQQNHGSANLFSCNFILFKSKNFWVGSFKLFTIKLL